MLQRVVGWCVCLVLVGLVPGCGGGAAFKRGAVEGTVKVAGEPLAEGTIRFIPAEGTVGQMVQAEIKDGAFGLKRGEGPSVGMQRVEITAFRKTGKTIKRDGVESEEIVQIIPAEYNTSSNLTANIQSGDNKLPEFDLKAAK